ncbi:MAG: hypothetical protein RSB51_06650 [Clostridia bacterium]
MSKIYTKYLEIKNKEKDENKIILFESGVFYIAVADDAITLSETLGLKLTNLTNEIVKSGFPKNKINIYLEKMQMNELKWQIINKENTDTLAITGNEIDKKIDCKNHIIESLKKINLDEITPKQAIDILYDIKIKADAI